MAKTKIDFKSLEIPAVVQKPLYAGVGAGDLAVAAVKDYVADAQKALTGYQKDVQKTVTTFDPKAVRASALSAAKARRALVEARVAELQAQAQKLPTTVQTVVNENVETVTGTYAELAKRGEAVVKGTKLPSSASVEVKVNTTKPAAKKAAKKPAAKKAPAKKAAAKKA